MVSSDSGAISSIDAISRDFNAGVYLSRRHVLHGAGERLAVIDDAGRYTYAQLSQKAERCAALLRKLGLRPEERIALCLLDSVDFPALFLGAMLAGVVAVPFNTLLTPQDYDYMLRDCRARLLVVSAPLFDKFVPILERNDGPEKIIVTNGQVEGYDGLDALLPATAPLVQAARTSCDDIAFWLYSSGSTGAPKGVMHTHANLLATAICFGERTLAIKAQDVCFSAAKLFFAYGLGNGLTFPFHAGATSVLMMERPTPASVMGVIARHRPSIFFGVPTLYNSILAAGAEVSGLTSDRLRLCVSAGEALPEEIGRRWQERYGVPIVDGLGSTEMLHIFLSNPPEAVKYGSSGRPVSGYTVRIVNEAGQDVPPGELGELIVSGPSAATGYWNQRAKTLATFRGPWTHTGDSYYVDSDGYHHYAGRGDDMLKVSGNWVSPNEVESTLISHPAVLEVAVIGAEDENGLIKPKAFIVLNPGYEANSELIGVLQNFIKQRLAPYKYPRWISFVDALPKTATGKIQRFRLRETQDNLHD